MNHLDKKRDELFPVATEFKSRPTDREMMHNCQNAWRQEGWNAAMQEVQPLVDAAEKVHTRCTCQVSVEISKALAAWRGEALSDQSGGDE